MDTPFGPRKITGNLQLAIPKELADRVHLRVGDQIYFLLNDERPEVLSIAPIELVDRWIEAGQRVLDDG